VVRKEPNLGTLRGWKSSAEPWAPPAGLAYPAKAAWQGGIVAPVYGLYTFVLGSGALGKVELDGRLVLDNEAVASNPASVSQVELVLAKGLHEVRLSGTLAGAKQGLPLRWALDGSTPRPVESKYLFSGTTGGLSG